MNDQLQKELTQAVKYHNLGTKIGMYGLYMSIALACIPVIGFFGLFITMFLRGSVNWPH